MRSKSATSSRLTTASTLRLKRAVTDLIDPQQDQVRYYQLCPTCHARTEMTPVSRQTDNPFALIV